VPGLAPAEPKGAGSRSTKLPAIAFALICGACTFSNSSHAKRVEGSRWTISVRCGGPVRSAVFEVKRGGMRATSSFGCFEPAEQSSSCKFCEPTLDGPCRKQGNGSTGPLVRVSGDVEAANALYVALDGSMGGYAIFYLSPQDKPGPALWRCETSAESRSDFEPCFKLGTYDGKLGQWSQAGDSACQLALKSTQFE
jgi:hypothetical protein